MASLLGYGVDSRSTALMPKEMCQLSHNQWSLRSCKVFITKQKANLRSQSDILGLEPHTHEVDDDNDNIEAIINKIMHMT